MTASREKPRVILIREWENQMSSSGCCGRLEGDFLIQNGERCFAERRDVMEAMGPLYQDLRSEYGDGIHLNVVDPRNLVTVVGLLAKDVRAGRVGILGAVRTLFGMTVTTVIINGRIHTRGHWPTIHEVKEVLGEPERIPEGAGSGVA